MDRLELLEILERGEDSKHQFKRDITNATQAAAEMAAFANSKGGKLVIGVENDGAIHGLSKQDANRISELLASATSNQVNPPLNPISENHLFDEGIVIVLFIEEGLQKPYITNEGIVWVKTASDKRKVTAKEELRRIFADADFVHADEVPVNYTTTNDLDMSFFEEYYQQHAGYSWQEEDLPFGRLISSMDILKEDKLTLGGLLLFGKNPQRFKSQFLIRAIHFQGNDETADTYLDSEDITGKLAIQFANSLAFVKRNIKKIQGNQDRNSQGKWNIPEIVFEELIANALLHRDYFINAPIRMFIFDNRIELISPGKLPNNLTVDNIRVGISVSRNPLLVSFATKTKPPFGIKYRGAGTGIRRALRAWPQIQLYNQTDSNQFKVIIPFQE